MLGVFFLIFSHFSPIEIIDFDKNFSDFIEDMNFLSSNVNRYFTSDYFCKSSGV